MSLLELLLADLERQYYFSGLKNKKATVWGLITKIFSPRFLPVVLCRLAHSFYLKKLNPIAKIFSLLNFILFGIEIAIRCEIGKGLYFPHTVGTVIGAERIGENTVIYHGVTLGAKEIDISYSDDKRPVIGNNIVIGSGAKILGGITLGDNIKIGANAVVLNSFSSNVVVGGIPAKILVDLASKDRT